MRRQGVLIRLIVAWGMASTGMGWAAPPDADMGLDPNAPVYEMPVVIELALRSNPIVMGADAVIQQTQGQRITAGAYPNPTVIGQTGGLFQDSSSGAQIRGGGGGSAGNDVVTVEQPLEWFGKRSARKREADAGIAGAVASLAEAKLNLIADVKIAFYDLLVAQQALELAKQNQEIVGAVARIVRARVKSGEAPEFEAIKADVEVLKTSQVVTRAQNTIRVSRVVLDTLTSGQLGPSYRIRGDFDFFPTHLELKTLTAQALDRHPTIMRLQKLVEGAGLTLVKEEQSRVPDVTVFGGAQVSGQTGFFGGVSLPAPVWYLRQGEIATALGAKRRGEAELLRARNDLLKAVNQHFQDAQATAKLIEVFEQGLLKQAQQALRIAELSFQQGASNLLEVLDAQRVLRQVLVEYLQARYDLSVSMAKLERAVAGMI